MTLYLRPKELGVKIQNKLKFCFWLEILNRKNQVAYLVLQVAYLVGNSDKIFWLACTECVNQDEIICKRQMNFENKKRLDTCSFNKKKQIVCEDSKERIHHFWKRKESVRVEILKAKLESWFFIFTEKALVMENERLDMVQEI